MNDNVVTIVGGGASTVSLIDAMLDKMSTSHNRQSRLTLFVVEKRPQLGSGTAYADDSATNLLNTKAGFISPFSDKPGHFYRWLVENRDLWEDDFPDTPIDPDGFLPRPLFGLYLSHMMRQLCQRAVGLGCRIVPIAEEATRIAFSHDGKVVVSTGGKLALPSDHVVLSCGAGIGRDYNHLTGQPGFFATPYPIKRLTRCIGKEDRVAIIGTRLSAVDAVLGLAHSGHKGPITLHSRTGMLPAVRGAQGRYQPQLLTRDFVEAHIARTGEVRLDTFLDWTMQEMASAGVSDLPEDLSIFCQPSHPIDFLSREVAAAQKPRPWQAVLYATNSVIDIAWSAMPDADKARFWPYLSWWMSYRVSIPVENATKILALMRAGQVKVLTGPVAVGRSGNGFAIDVTHDSEISRHDYEALIVATGTPRDARQIDCPLIQSLIEQGTAAPHPFGGLKISAGTGALVDERDQVDERITALGELTSGTFFFTSVLEINARHAAQRADTILQKLRSDRGEVGSIPALRRSA